MLGDLRDHLILRKRKQAIRLLKLIGRKLRSFVTNGRPVEAKNRCVLVSRDEFFSVLDEICKQDEIAFDTETTGLYPYHGDCPFSMAVSTRKANYYFNFNNAVDIPASLMLDPVLFPEFQRLFDHRQFVFAQNAKFDMHQLHTLDWSKVDVYCTENMGRIRNNERKSYSLKNQAPLVGREKDDTVEKHIKDLKLFATRTRGPKSWKQPLYDKVPFQMIAKYAMIDSEVCLELGIQHYCEIKKLPAGTTKNPMKVLANEVRVTRTLYKAEKIGTLCDIEYTEESLKKGQKEHGELIAAFKDSTGIDYIDSPLVFSRVFYDSDKERFVKSEKKGYSFSKDVLKHFHHPAAKMVSNLRRVHTETSFFKQFLFAADDEGVIHTDYRQPGTRTGRFSSRNPNLQNLKKSHDDEDDIVVRRAIIPRPGYRFFMIDYDQMEYRMMLDYAGAKGLIELVYSGLDVHEATAELAGVTRAIAKNVNFGTLYGQGMDSLAASIGVKVDEAKAIQESIFDAAPEIRSLIYNVQAAARSRRELYNWAGRPYKFPYRGMAYKAPNTLIQGGAAEVVRFAMTAINDYLEDKKCDSRMLLNVHDELIFEIRIGEEEVVKDLLHIMETTYPHKHLPLTCGVDFSDKSLADKEKWDE